MIDAAIEAGARKVYLLETAVATAMGAGVDISKADGHMIIDIGGGTTEVAIVSPWRRRGVRIYKGRGLEL